MRSAGVKAIIGRVATTPRTRRSAPSGGTRRDTSFAGGSRRSHACRTYPEANASATTSTWSSTGRRMKKYAAGTSAASVTAATTAAGVRPEKYSRSRIPAINAHAGTRSGRKEISFARPIGGRGGACPRGWLIRFDLRRGA